VDTGHNFPETIEFRDRLVKELGLLIVRNVQDAIDEGKVVEETGNTQVEIVCKQLLLDAIEEFKFDACIGARRDEEKHELKSVFFLFVMILVNGTKKPTSRVI
jgi:sulfate adenylyltransferase subunit 2